MRKFKGYVATNTVGSEQEFEFEVDDTDTQKVIDNLFEEMVWDNIEATYWEVDDNGDRIDQDNP